ncbi:hypothetical protein MNBD_BACTEROID05-881 [hydrothermal vent metagenome]|uniref:DNA translocase FtsK 4TM region domain-containing protein n=1 Tax=hydrothermal vent metagenome TaxID=652676 RepID=A0A3B0T5N4_9ZZZZ
MKEEHINEIKAIIILAFGMIFLASLISFVPDDLPWYTSNPNVPTQNLIRITGAYLSGTLFFVFGYSSYFLVVFLFFWAWNKFTSQEISFTVSKLIIIPLRLKPMVRCGHGDITDTASWVTERQIVAQLLCR